MSTPPPPMTGVSVHNSNQLSTRARVRGQAHHWLPSEENIRTADDRNGDGVAGDKSHHRGVARKPSPLPSSRHHGERRTSYMGEGYEVRSFVFTVCFGVFIGVCDARLGRFLHTLGRLLEPLQHTLTMVGSKHSVLRAVMSSERQGLIDWLGKGV